jgi:hypothetical protein
MACWNVLRDNCVFWLYWSSKTISLSEAHAIPRVIACGIVSVQRGTRAGFSHSDLILPCQSSFHQYSVIICYNPCGVHRPDHKAPCHRWSSLEIHFCPGTHLYRVQRIKHHHHLYHDQGFKNHGHHVTTATEFPTWVPSTELASCLSYDAQNFEVAPGFL